MTPHRSVRRRLVEWANRGVGPALLRATLEAYDRMIGLDLEDLASRGPEGLGVRLGRPSSIPAEVVARIVAERAAGRGLRVITEGLTTDGRDGPGVGRVVVGRHRAVRAPRAGCCRAGQVTGGEP